MFYSYLIYHAKNVVKLVTFPSRDDFKFLGISASFHIAILNDIFFHYIFFRIFYYEIYCEMALRKYKRYFLKMHACPSLSLNKTLLMKLKPPPASYSTTSHHDSVGMVADGFMVARATAG